MADRPVGRPPHDPAIPPRGATGACAFLSSSTGLHGRSRPGTTGLQPARRERIRTRRCRTSGAVWRLPVCGIRPPRSPSRRRPYIAARDRAPSLRGGQSIKSTANAPPSGGAVRRLGMEQRRSPGLVGFRARAGPGSTGSRVPSSGPPARAPGDRAARPLRAGEDADDADETATVTDAVSGADHAGASTTGGAVTAMDDDVLFGAMTGRLTCLAGAAMVWPAGLRRRMECEGPGGQRPERGPGRATGCAGSLALHAQARHVRGAPGAAAPMQRRQARAPDPLERLLVAACAAADDVRHPCQPVGCEEGGGVPTRLGCGGAGRSTGCRRAQRPAGDQRLGDDGCVAVLGNLLARRAREVRRRARST